MPVLYHASQNKDLAVIEPQQTLSKDKYIGEYVFATSDKILAIMYLVKGYGTLLGTHDNPPNIVICADKNDFLIKDKGGAIYELPAGSFTKSPQNELSDYELVSNLPVAPIRKTIYDKSLSAIKDAGIMVHFVDLYTFNNLINSPIQAELIKELPVYID